MAKFTCIECGDKYIPNVNGDTEERLCHHCLMNEDEYSVTVIASFGVMAKSQEDADNYILEQFCGGNIEYTSGVETVKIADKVVKYG